MNLKSNIFILLVSFSAVSLACNTSGAASENREEIVLNDGYTSAKPEEVIINEASVNGNDIQISTSKPNSQEAPKTSDDNSEITTMHDGFGNKTEIRNFKGHPRLKFLVLRTSADGQQQIFVYGYEKEVKTLSGETMNKALTASGDEIANAAGLYQTTSSKELPNYLRKSKPMQPTPSYNYPVQIPQPTQSQTEDFRQESEEQNPVPETNSKTGRSDESTSAVRQPLDEN